MQWHTSIRRRRSSLRTSGRFVVNCAYPSTVTIFASSCGAMLTKLLCVSRELWEFVGTCLATTFLNLNFEDASWGNVAGSLGFPWRPLGAKWTAWNPMLVNTRSGEEFLETSTSHSNRTTTGHTPNGSRTADSHNPCAQLSMKIGDNVSWIIGCRNPWAGSHPAIRRSALPSTRPLNKNLRTRKAVRRESHAFSLVAIRQPRVAVQHPKRGGVSPFSRRAAPFSFFGIDAALVTRRFPS